MAPPRMFAIGSFAAAVAALTTLTALAAFLGGWEGANTVGTWVGAVGTAGAFAAALYLYDREARRDRDRDD